MQCNYSICWPTHNTQFTSFHIFINPVYKLCTAWPTMGTHILSSRLFNSSNSKEPWVCCVISKKNMSKLYRTFFSKGHFFFKSGILEFVCFLRQVFHYSIYIASWKLKYTGNSNYVFLGKDWEEEYIWKKKTKFIKQSFWRRTNLHF